MRSAALALAAALAVTGCGKRAPKTAPAEAPAPRTEARLVVASDPVRPGETLSVGLHLKLSPGWHTYWVNPGDAGQAPKIVWTTEPLLNLGPLRFAAPKRIETPSAGSSSVSYGYEGEALFWTEAAVPEGAKPGDALKIDADARWLVCAEICVPEKRRLSASVAVAASSKPSAAKPLFDAAREAFPKPWTGEAVFRVDGEEVVLKLKGPLPAAGSPVFFPLDPGQIQNAAPQKTEAQGDGLEIRLRKSPALAAPPGILRGVLNWGGAAFTLEAALKESL